MAMTRRLPRLPARYDPRRPGPADGWDELPDHEPVRLRRWLTILAAGWVALLGWVATHGAGPGLLSVSAHGYVTLILAAVLMVMLLVHRADGLRHLVRVLAEYAVVALLAVLLATTGTPGATRNTPATPTTQPPAPAHTTPADGGDGGSQPSAVGRVRDWLTGLWHRADQAAGRLVPSPPSTSTPAPATKTKTTEGR